jgi:ABC-type oligopeptide transport system ATPase subunit
MSAPVLELTGVSVDYPVKGGTFRAVNSVSFTVEAGQTVALVGESGCGKTTLARAILGLQPYSGAIKLADERVDGASASKPNG